MEEWSDYARGLVDDPKASRMREHAAGCVACSRAVESFSLVMQTARADQSWTVPPDVFARAVALFTSAPERPAIWRRLIAAMTFDSFAQPLPLGVRSAGGLVRQLRYQAEEFALHIHLDRSSAASPLAIVGQILVDSFASQNPALLALSGGEIALFAGNNLVQQIRCNSFGEFVVECRVRPDLWLRVTPDRSDVQIEVPLDSMLQFGSSSLPR